MDNTIATMKNILMGCAVAATLSATLASCADDLDMFGNPNVLQVEVEDEWTAQQGTRVAYSDGGIHTEFQQGDAIGVYAFDGTEYKYSNVKFTKQSGDTWTGALEMKYNPNYTYFAYFPYDEAGIYTPTTGADDEVDTRFATFIADASDIFWKADQSTKANFDQSNLMISQGETTTIPRVRFVMNHKRGLAVFGGGETKKNVGTYALDTVEYKMTIENLPNAFRLDPDAATFYYLTKPETKTNLDGMTIEINQGKYRKYDHVPLDENTTYEYSTLSDDGTTWSEYGTDKPSWLTTFDKVTQDDGSCYFSLKTDPEIQSYTGPNGENEIYWGDADHPCVNYESAPPKAVDNELSGRDAAVDVDLSMVDNGGKAQSKRSTANCYLVHAPGTYKLPLVYGNAITKGETDTLAYRTDSVSYGKGIHFPIFHTFLSHANKEIIDPWIENNKGEDDNNINVDGAKLVWEDMKGMIGSVGISSGSDGKYLTFAVDKDHIAEGNALVAAMSGGTIVWTWHIWVTKQTMEITSEATAGNYTYKIANVNLGAVHAKFSKKCKINAKDNQGVAVSLDVENQLWTGIDAQHSVVNTYYQSGRHTPVPPFESSNLYDGSGNLFTSTISPLSAGEATIGMTIQNPNVLYRSVNNKLSELGGDPKSSDLYLMDSPCLWNVMNNTIAVTVKTIYDPCPPGYCIPPHDLTSHYSYKDVNEDTLNFEGTVNNIAYKCHFKDNGLSGVNFEFSPNIFMPMSGAKLESTYFCIASCNGVYSCSSTICQRGLGLINLIFSFRALQQYDFYNLSGTAIPVRPILEE